MKNAGKMKEQLIDELAELRRQNAELRASQVRHKKVEETLREQNERLEILFEYAPDAYYLNNLSGTLVDGNRAAEEVTGYNRDELIGKSFLKLKLLSPMQLLKAAGLLAKNALGRPTGPDEFTLNRKDGSQVTVEIRTFPIRIKDQPLVLGIARDITQRDQMEERIRQQNVFLNDVLESLAHPFYVIDVNDYAIKMVNSAAHLGDISAGVTCYNLTHRNSEPCSGEHPCPIEEIKRTKRPIMVEHVHYDRDGNLKNVEIHAYPILDNKGNVIQIIEYCLDITQRKRMEEELLKTQKLESIGVLAGGIAHDLNNLLTAVVGNISLAKVHEDPADKNRRLEEAERASMRIKDLTQQLLTFSKGGAPILQTADIAGLLRDSATFALRGSNIRYESSISDDLWTAKIDEGQINQVINNLVINSQQAMPNGGTVKIGAENVTIGAESGFPLKAGAYIKISVEDRGPGISEEHIQKIFDPFFTTKQAGNGLGLATSYSIIQKHGGHITVESELGVGSTFHIYLPAFSEKTLVVKERTKAAPIVGEGKILVMDDEKHIRDLAAEMLSSLGYGIVTSIDGAEALEIYRDAMESEKPFDAIIIDLTIPGGMGGKETIQRLREMDPEVKAIVSSGYSSDPIMSYFSDYGFSGVIAKPYMIRELSEVLHSVITE